MSSKQKRRQISKKLRFDVFKRDLFVCQYCGQAPPKVVLEIDHIQPVKHKGGDDADNLITACFNCNRGKAAIKLSAIPSTITEKAAKIAEAEEQYKEYNKLLRRREKRINKEVDGINEIYKSYFPGWELSQGFRVSVKMFIQKLGAYVVEEAMHKSCSITRLNVNSNDDAARYFCGICWRTIRGDIKQSLY